MTKQTKPVTVKVQFGKGVMSKDGKTPFALQTMMATRKPNEEGHAFSCPVDYSIANIAAFLGAEEYTRLSVIDEKNNQYTFIKV